MFRVLSSARKGTSKFSLAVLSSHIALSSALFALAPIAASAIAIDTCNGLPATIVSDAATINGTSGDDVILGGAGNNTINGNGGNDTICGAGGNDILNGGFGNDDLFGDAGDDQLNGDVGNDTLHGGAGNDTLSGGANTDSLFGDAGYDTLNGNLGNDGMDGGADTDICTDIFGTNTSTACEGSGLQGIIVIHEDSVPNHSQDFAYTGFSSFTLDDDANGTNANEFSMVKSSGLFGTSYTSTQSASPAVWSLTGLTCVDPSSGSAVNIGTRTATIDLDTNEVVTCTFTNTSPDADSDGVIDDEDNCVDVANPLQEATHEDPDGYGDACISDTTVVVLHDDLDTTSSSPAVVSADGLNKWFFYNDESDTIDNALGSMVVGPLTPDMGVGSAQISATGTQRRNLATYQFKGIALSTVHEMSFSTLSQSAGNGSGLNAAPFLFFNVDFNGTDTWQRRLIFVPSQNGVVAADTWQTWDAVNNGSAQWAYSGASWPAPLAGPNIGITGVAGTTLKTWNQILIDYPNAKTRTTDSLLGMRVGEPYPAGFTGNIDNFYVKIKGDKKTFDFDVDVEACNGSTFDTDTYGSVNGQDGWMVTGPYDQAVEPNIYGYPLLGCKVLRISDAVASGSFGDQTFSKPLANEAGETSAQNGGFSSGTRQNHFESQFDIASAIPTAEQTGLHVSVSPDRGDGARMSYLRFEDQADGVHVFFDDYQDVAPFGLTIGDANGCDDINGDDFVESDIATLDRSIPHTVKLTMDFVDGARNDVVKVYIDGIEKKVGTSWEDYFRYCESNETRTVDSLLFRVSGTAHPANSDNGFLFDNFTAATSLAAPVVTFTGIRNQASGTYDNAQPIMACGLTTASGYIAFEWADAGTDPSVSYEYKILSGPTAVGYTQIHTDTHHNGGIPVAGTYTVQVTPTDALGHTGAPVTCEVTYDPNFGSSSSASSVSSSSSSSSEAMACVPEDEDLIANWKLDENVAAEFADDATANDHTGSVTGATSGATGTPSLSFYNGGAYDFDGVNDSIDLGSNVGNFTLAEHFTVSAWINPELDSQNHAIYGNTWSNAGYLLRVNAENKVRFILVENGNVYKGVDSNFLTPGWHHVVGTWDGTNVKVYVDGVEESITPIENGTVTTITTTNHTFIGQTGEVGSEQYFNGLMDDVRVYNRALTLNEVDDLHDGACEAIPVVVPVSCTTTDTNLVAHWSMDENTGITAVDTSSEENDATVSGATWTVSTPTLTYDNTAALLFDGTNDVLSAPNDASLSFDVSDAFSASAWVNPVTFSGYQTILHKLDESTGAYRGYLFTLNNGTPELWLINDYTGGKYTVVPATSALSTGSWQQVGFTYDGSGNAAGVHIYINGVDVTGPAIIDALATETIQTSTAFEMGFRTVSGAQPLNGSLDEVRVYDAALTATHMSHLAAGACNAGVVEILSSSSISSSSSSSSSEGSSSSSSSSSGGDGEGSASSSSSVVFSGFAAPQTEEGGNGAYRGSRTNTLKGVAQFITGVFGSSNVAPGAFGGKETPLTDSEVKTICSMRKALPSNASSILTQWFAGYLAEILHRDADQILTALKDPEICKAPEVHAKAVEKPVAFNVDANGYPVSKNPVWNKCLTGKVTLADLRSNTDKDEDGVKRVCSDYHTASLWYHPDLNIFFTFDRKSRTITLPAGYVLQKLQAVTLNQ